MFRIALISFFLTGTAFATTWTVDDDGKADFSSIQDAIDVALNGDFISVQEGTYFESINFLGKEITVQGVSAEAVIIDGMKNPSPVVTFNSGETPAAQGIAQFERQMRKAHRNDQAGVFAEVHCLRQRASRSVRLARRSA